MTRCGKIGVLLLIAGMAATAFFSGGSGNWLDLRAYTVQGGSMEPEYSPGDLILTSTKGAQSVQPGEIIVFRADWASAKYEHRVVHRVAAVGQIDGLPIAYTRGDANLIADPRPVDLTSKEVRVVHFSLPAGGVWAELLAGPIMLALAVTTVAGLLGAILSMSKPLVVTTSRQFLQSMTAPVTYNAPARDLRFPY